MKLGTSCRRGNVRMKGLSPTGLASCHLTVRVVVQGFITSPIGSQALCGNFCLASADRALYRVIRLERLTLNSIQDAQGPMRARGGSEID